MNKLSLLFVLVCTLFTCGCGITPDPTEDDLRTADYGPKPSKNALDLHEQATKAYYDVALKDPESARYKFFPPKKGWFINRNKVRYAWQRSYTINAKNSYGGYTGAKLYWGWFRGDEEVGSGLQSEDFGDINTINRDYDWGDPE